MYPDDRVLVGVINRKRDLKFLLDEHWYRIPQRQMSRGIYAEYLAFYLSGSAASGYDQPGIHYYAQRSGLELCYRRDLIPDQPEHARADEVYYQVQLKNITQKQPPVCNPSRRPVAFIYSTWDRFIHAQIIKDLYSKDDYFVDRIYHALRDNRLRPQRYWSTERRETGYAPQVHILCESGTVIAATETAPGVDIVLDEKRRHDDILSEIRKRIAAKGGAITVNIPHRS